MNEKNNTLPLILAFLAGVVIAAMVAFAVVKQQGPPAAATPAATEAQPQSAEAADSAVKALNYTEAFPSWNPDSASLHALVDFVSACADPSGPDYLEPADRIATFDMDGTILCEKAPVYIDYCLTMYRVLDDPSFSATEEERDAMQQIRDHAYSEGETFQPAGLTKRDLVASAFAGMPPPRRFALTWSISPIMSTRWALKA